MSNQSKIQSDTTSKGRLKPITRGLAYFGIFVHGLILAAILAALIAHPTPLRHLPYPGLAPLLLLRVLPNLLIVICWVALLRLRVWAWRALIVVSLILSLGAGVFYLIACFKGLAGAGFLLFLIIPIGIYSGLLAYVLLNDSPRDWG